MKWIEEIETLSEQIKNDLAPLTIQELNLKPDSKTWSIAQNLEHLIVVNETYFPVLDALHNGTYKTPFIARIKVVVSFLGKTVLMAVQPDRKKKMKTFPIWEPSNREVQGDILTRFLEHQNELIRQIVLAEKLANSNTVIASPANKNIVYTLATAFEIIGSHEQRHWQQVQEVLSLLCEVNDQKL